MRIIVTGASGFLGGRTVPRLVAAGHEVVALARSETAEGVVVALGAVAVRGDLEDPASVEAAFLKSDAAALVALAPLALGRGPVVAAAAERCGLERAVFISSTSIFTSVPSASTASRLAAEEAIVGSGLRWTILRPTMIYGRPGDRNMERLLRRLRRSRVLPLPGGGNRLQQPVHVDDLAATVAIVVERPATAGQSYDVAGPDALTFRDVVAQAGAAVGRVPWLVPVPLGLAVTAVGAYERLSPRPRLRAEQLERLGEDKAFDISAARRDLAHDPRPFADGIAAEAALLG